ncbi:jg11877 [Pararge aegeria aegeria]|uniref:Jg11877 protein n=1 Tax=Pararge aegeria aegeria TaxID=348720 RepID=A0A8S4SMH4_9NEOP|nr:jg11877 [Pararge aegeria aegeria]
MKTVLVCSTFGILLAVANAREIANVNSGSDGSGSYGEGFGSNGFAYGDRKTDERFRTYVNPLGNIVSRAQGGAAEIGGILYPRITDNGKVVYTKSDYRNHGSYDSSTVTYSGSGNSRISDDFDGRGVLDVRSNIGSDESRRAAGHNGFKGFNSANGYSNNESGFKSDVISGSALHKPNAGYGDLNRLNGNSGGFIRNYGNQDRWSDNSRLGGIGNKQFSDGYQSLGRFGSLNLGNTFGGIGNVFGNPFNFPGFGSGSGIGGFNPSTIFSQLPGASGSGLGGFNPSTIFSQLPGGSSLSQLPGGSALSQIAGGNIINQKLEDELGNSNGGSAFNGCGSGSCGGYGDNGKYAFATASASAGNYGK